MEDWKRVIWSDETSIVFGQRRGAERVWRTVQEVSAPTVIRRCWKGFSEFMFWGCFTYDQKGPCHVWKKETTAEKRKAQRGKDEYNNAHEAAAKEEWELETCIKRMKLRGIGGKKPRWVFNNKTGAQTRTEGRGGIDWYRYNREILRKKLLPFAKSIPNAIVQEDGAPSHISKWNQTEFDGWEVQRLLWPGNSPDLNMIEPCWFWMKKVSNP